MFEELRRRFSSEVAPRPVYAFRLDEVLVDVQEICGALRRSEISTWSSPDEALLEAWRLLDDNFRSFVGSWEDWEHLKAHERDASRSLASIMRNESRRDRELSRRDRELSRRIDALLHRVDGASSERLEELMRSLNWDLPDRNVSVSDVRVAFARKSLDATAGYEDCYGDMAQIRQHAEAREQHTRRLKRSLATLVAGATALSVVSDAANYAQIERLLVELWRPMISVVDDATAGDEGPAPSGPAAPVEPGPGSTDAGAKKARSAVIGPYDNFDGTTPVIAEGIAPGRLRTTHHGREKEPKPIAEQTPEDVFGPESPRPHSASGPRNVAEP